MGYYINNLPNGEKLPSLGKAEALLTIEGATQIPQPTKFQDDIVCVVDNGIFEAAGYAYSPEELEVFSRPDGRPKVWLKIPGAKTLAK